jgi:flagellar biosynthesis chaperone FliJ
MAETKKRLTTKEQEVKEANTELGKARKELLAANNQLSSLKSKHEIDINKLQKRIDESML